MSELRINLSDYKASGVYFVEIDNSVITRRSYNAASRLAVGFSTVGPFNRPVFLSGPADVAQLFGGIDRKLERKGCFTNRNIRTMVSNTPIFAINLMPIDTKESSTNADLVGYSTLSMTAEHENFDGKTLYAYLYDRSRFWIADDNTFVKNVFLTSANEEQEPAKQITDYADAAPFGVGNCGTKDISLIVRKAEGLTGYNVTFLDWYGNEESIPYKWVNPRDYVSDYFVQVVAIAGKWDKATYEAYSTDIMWSNYFDKNGLKKSKLSKFLRLDYINVIGNWTGCLLPNFIDKQGNDKSIDYLINKSCNTTGLLWGVNTNALDSLCLSNRIADEDGVVSTQDEYQYFVDHDGDGAYSETIDAPGYYNIDPCGHTLDATGDVSVSNFMSYYFNPEKESMRQAEELFFAAKITLPDAMAAYAQMLRYGETEKFHASSMDIEESTKLINQAADRGSVLAAVQSARHRMFGNHCEAEPQQVACEIEQRLANEPNTDPLWYTLLGHAYLEQGQREKAAEQYEQALALGELDVYPYLASIYQQRGNMALSDSYMEEGCNRGIAVKPAFRLHLKSDVLQHLKLIFVKIQLLQNHRVSFNGFSRCKAQR